MLHIHSICLILTVNKLIKINIAKNNNPKLRFKNDPHWNEYGNLEYAKNLYNIFVKKCFFFNLRN